MSNEDILKKAINEEVKIMKKFTEKFIKESDDYSVKSIKGNGQDLVFKCQACGCPRTITAKVLNAFRSWCDECEADRGFEFYMRLKDIPKWDRKYHLGGRK